MFTIFQEVTSNATSRAAVQHDVDSRRLIEPDVDPPETHPSPCDPPHHGSHDGGSDSRRDYEVRRGTAAAVVRSGAEMPLDGASGGHHPEEGSGEDLRDEADGQDPTGFGKHICNPHLTWRSFRRRGLCRMGQNGGQEESGLPTTLDSSSLMAGTRTGRPLLVPSGESKGRRWRLDQKRPPPTSPLLRKRRIEP